MIPPAKTVIPPATGSGTSPEIGSESGHGTEWDGMGLNGTEFENLPALTPKMRKFSFGPTGPNLENGKIWE